MLLQDPTYSFDDLGTLQWFLDITPVRQRLLLSSIEIAWFVTGPVRRLNWHPHLSRRLFPTFRMQQLQQWEDIWNVLSLIDGLDRLHVSLLAPHLGWDPGYWVEIVESMTKVNHGKDFRVFLFERPKRQGLVDLQDVPFSLFIRGFDQRVVW